MFIRGHDGGVHVAAVWRAEPGRHMAPAADAVTSLLVMKLVIRDFISSLLPLWQFQG